MEKIGIFGGTFNPPHLGHIRAAEFAIEALGLTKLIWMPCKRTPGKDIPAFSADDAQRLALTKLAAAGNSKMTVSDLELKGDGCSYTCDTVDALKKQYQNAEFTLLLGTDAFLKADKWINGEILSKGLHYAVFLRGDRVDEKVLETQKARLEGWGAEVRFLQNPVTFISSTQVRRLLAFQAADVFLTEPLTDYIRAQGLYAVNADWKQLPMEALEPIVVALLHPNRVKHVLGVRDTAREMAKKWDVDETDAARAGLLHDITKALDGPLQLTLCDAYGKILSDFSRRYPRTLHALTGSLVADRIFGENEQVVTSICCHTTGKANMTDLDKIIYVADYMEPNRDFPGVEELRYLAFHDLTGALKLGLEMTLDHLKRQGNEVSPESREALDFLNQK